MRQPETWVLAREYAAEYGLDAAYRTFGTTGYFDEDMKRLQPVKLPQPTPSVTQGKPAISKAQHFKRAPIYLRNE